MSSIVSADAVPFGSLRTSSERSRRMNADSLSSDTDLHEMHTDLMAHDTIRNTQYEHHHEAHERHERNNPPLYTNN